MALEENGIKVRGRLFVASGAHVLMPYHKRFDELQEARRKRRSIGTTGRGIGPAYLDKLSRSGLRMGDLLVPHDTLERLAIERILDANEVLQESFQAEPLPAKVLAEELVFLAQSLKPAIVDAFTALRGVREGTETALLEGAQGTMLDVDHGTYPFVTSSSCSVGGALTGTGLPPRALGEIWGVFKAYCTRVGNGPFPTELLGRGRRVAARSWAASTAPPRAGPAAAAGSTWSPAATPWNSTGCRAW